MFLQCGLKKLNACHTLCVNVANVFLTGYPSQFVARIFASSRQLLANSGQVHLWLSRKQYTAWFIATQAEAFQFRLVQELTPSPRDFPEVAHVTPFDQSQREPCAIFVFTLNYKRPSTASSQTPPAKRPAIRR